MAIVASGRLDQRITLQKKTIVRGSLGGHDETWTTLAVVYAETLDMSGRELFNARAMGSSATIKITIRWRNDVHPDMRVLFSDGTMAGSNGSAVSRANSSSSCTACTSMTGATNERRHQG